MARVAGKRAKRDPGSEQLSKWPTCRYRLSGKAKLELTFPKQGVELPGKQEKLRGHPATVAKAPAEKGLHGCAITVGKLGKQHKRSMVLTAQLNKTDCAGQVHKLADQTLAHV